MANGLILVPVDFEEGSNKALELAKELASRLDAEVALLHVYMIPVYTYPGLNPAAVPGVFTEVIEAAQQALDELKRSSGVSRAVLRGGDTATEILATAHELGATMIAMGTHGRSGFGHFLLGSVAEKVVRRSPVPVLTLRTQG
jgi:nucleotide-binding universal stress UspA family protein